jgi:hypothetical protein
MRRCGPTAGTHPATSPLRAGPFVQRRGSVQELAVFTARRRVVIDGAAGRVDVDPNPVCRDKSSGHAARTAFSGHARSRAVLYALNRCRPSAGRAADSAGSRSVGDNLPDFRPIAAILARGRSPKRFRDVDFIGGLAAGRPTRKCFTNRKPNERTGPRRPLIPCGATAGRRRAESRNSAVACLSSKTPSVRSGSFARFW